MKMMDGNVGQNLAEKIKANNNQGQTYYIIKKKEEEEEEMICLSD